MKSGTLDGVDGVSAGWSFAKCSVHGQGIGEGFGVVFLHVLPLTVGLLGASNASTPGQRAVRVLASEPIEQLRSVKGAWNLGHCGAALDTLFGSSLAGARPPQLTC